MEGSISIEQQYALKWNDFHTKLMSSFQNLRNEFDFVDVTIACDGQSFSAHKVILSACSPYFRRLLKANPCPHPIIILRDVKKKSMENLLLFMYNGEVHLEPSAFSDFIKTAKMLQIEGLTDIKHNFNPPCLSVSPHSQTARNLNVQESAKSRESPNNSEQNEQEYNTMETDHPQSSEQPLFETHSREIINTTDITLHPKSEPFETGHSEQSSVETSANIDDITPLDQFVKSSTFTGALSMLQSNAESSSHSQSFSQNSRTVQPNNSEQTNHRSPVQSSFIGKESTQCPVCKRNYSSASNLKAHILNVHSTTSLNNWYQCRECGKKCKTKHYLINHEMRVHGIRQRSKQSGFFNFLNEDTL